jgi:hypothetical protein
MRPNADQTLAEQKDQQPALVIRSRATCQHAILTGSHRTHLERVLAVLPAGVADPHGTVLGVDRSDADEETDEQ